MMPKEMITPLLSVKKGRKFNVYEKSFFHYKDKLHRDS